MAYSPYRHLPYSEFVQACRAFKPSELVPAIAKMSAALAEPPYPKMTLRTMPPWGLAAAARESLLHGNEHRSNVVDERALAKLMRIYQIAMDDIPDGPGHDHFLVTQLTVLAYEQMPYSESIFEELARSHAWLIGGLDEVETKVISERSLTAMLGGLSLHETIGATFFLQVGALQNGGIYNAGWLDQPNFVEVLEMYPRANIEAVAERLTTTPEAFRASYNQLAVGTSAAERYDYNPLRATPFVDMGDGVPVAPATRLILRTATPSGLYYTGVQAYGNDFANDLGLLFEYYIGRQLRLIDGAEVHPEIVYGRRGGQKSVDWFVVLPDIVLLVEVKSRRLSVGAQAGDSRLIRSLEDAIVRPRNQLERTIDQLSMRDPKFSHIPTDRQMLAVVVTAEPFYTGSAYLLDFQSPMISGGSLPDVPFGVISARVVEMLVTHGADLGPMLLDEIERAATDGGAINLQRIAGTRSAQNEILSDAWDAYPLPSRPGKELKA